MVLPGGTEVSSGDPIEIGTDSTVLLPDGGSVTRPDGTALDVGAGTTVSVDGTVNDPTASGPSDGSGDSEGGPGGSGNEIGNAGDGSTSGNKLGSDDRGALPETNDVMGSICAALVICATAMTSAGFAALRRARE